MSRDFPEGSALASFLGGRGLPVPRVPPARRAQPFLWDFPVPLPILPPSGGELLCLHPPRLSWALKATLGDPSLPGYQFLGTDQICPLLFLAPCPPAAAALHPVSGIRDHLGGGSSRAPAFCLS